VAYCSQYILDDAVGCEKERLHPNDDGNTKFAMLFAEDEIHSINCSEWVKNTAYCGQQTTFLCNTVAVSC
jgi:hypothetical protein